MPFYERQPYIQPLHQLVAEVLSGEVRVPLFQRPGTEQTWSPEQRGDLLDSVYRGFPIGMVLLWSTRTPVGTYPRIGPFAIPKFDESSQRLRRLLLDGHQRVSTLVSILGRGLASELDLRVPPVAANEERWVFDISQLDDRRSRDRFILLKPGETPADNQFELGGALNRLDLNAWIRGHPDLNSEQIRLLDSLRDRLREYTIPVAVLAAETLDEATESFKRVNSSGTPMGPFHMVAARAYAANFDLQEEFNQRADEVLGPVGWSSLDRTDLLRICTGLFWDAKSKRFANPLKLDVEDGARRLREDKNIISRATEGARIAAEFLQTCGVHGPEALPYSYQFVTLAIFAARRSHLLTETEKEAMRRWFWFTTYGEVYGGVNSTIFERGLTALEQMVEGGDHSAMMRDLTSGVEEPTRFDYRTARSKACALAMARYQDDQDPYGPAQRALAERGVNALDTLYGSRSRWESRVIVVPPDTLASLRQVLRQRANGTGLADLVLGIDDPLARYGVPPDASGDAQALISARRQNLASAERRFVEALGLTWQQTENVPE